MAPADPPHERLLADFARDAADVPDLEVDVVATLLQRKTALGDRQPGRWREGDLASLLLDDLPRVVRADEQWWAAVVPTTRAFLTWLHREGRMHRASAPVSSLYRELDEVAAELAGAVDDAPPSLTGLVLDAMGVSNAPTQAELDDAMRRFNALPFEERERITAPVLGPVHPVEDDADDADDEPLHLPVVLLPPLEDLVAAVEEAPLLRQALVLLRMAASRRLHATTRGVLRREDAVAFSRAAGLPEPSPAFRSAMDLAELHRLWVLAEVAGLVEPGATVSTGPVGTAYVVGGDVGALWVELAVAALRLGPDVDDVVARRSAADGALAGVLAPMLVSTSYEGPTPISRLVDVVAADIPSARGLPAPTVRAWAQEAVDEQLEVLRRLSLLTPDPDAVELTDAGRWALATLLERLGHIAPVAHDLESWEPMQVLRLIRTQLPEEQQRVWQQWASGRDADQVLGATLDALAAESDSLDRVVAVQLLLALSVDPRSAVLRAADRRTRAHLRAAAGQELDAQEHQTVLLDALAAMTLLGEDLDDTPPVVWEMAADLDWSAVPDDELPEARAVAALVAEGHPDAAVRRAAERAVASLDAG